jgi:hypothetical protein
MDTTVTLSEAIAEAKVTSQSNLEPALNDPEIQNYAGPYAGKAVKALFVDVAEIGKRAGLGGTAFEDLAKRVLEAAYQSYIKPDQAAGIVLRERLRKGRRNGGQRQDQHFQDQEAHRAR